MHLARNHPTGVRTGGGFTLIETAMMLTALVVFTLLLAGLTKPRWGDAKLISLEETENEEVSDYIIDESYLQDAQKGATPAVKAPETRQ